jgi:hypothetical protein
MSDGRVPDQDRDPSAARELATDIGTAMNAVVLEPMVEHVVGTISMVVLLVLMVPVGLVILIVSFVGMALLLPQLGNPSGTAGSALVIVWLIGTLAVLSLVFRKMYRRMPRRLRDAYAAPMDLARPIAGTAALSRAFGGDALEGEAPGAPSVPAPTLAELDARLAPKPVTEPPAG